MNKLVKFYYWLSVLLIAIIFPVCKAEILAPEQITNPNIADRSVYIADPGNILSESAKRRINKYLYDLRMKTSAEIAVAVIPEMGEMPIENFSEKIFSDWSLGKKDKDNGVLLVIAMDRKEARITTGYGTEGVIPDIVAKKIITDKVLPNMKAGNPDKAVEEATVAIGDILLDPTNADEIKSRNKEAWETPGVSPVSTDDLTEFIGIIVILMFIFSICLFFYDSNRIKKMDRPHQAQEWHSRRQTYLALSFLSLGLGLIPYFLAEKRRKASRNKPLECATCHHKMIKLDEDQDNELLNSSQDFEEKLNTVDYDVWVCPECGSIERYAFKINQNKYTECPNCHTVAYTMTRDHTLVPPTVNKTGTGERIYECKYCRYKKNQRYILPRRQNYAGAALAAGSILGSGSGRGGGIGGGFGGGRTGGGGATGRW